jgi:hypothetical protein
MRERELTSKQAIIIPHAGAIFVIRGTSPAYSAETPSLRTISFKTVKVPAAPEPPIALDIRSDCFRVLSTSKGEVKSAAKVPLVAPLANDTPAPS